MDRKAFFIILAGKVSRAEYRVRLLKTRPKGKQRKVS